MNVSSLHPLDVVARQLGGRSVMAASLGVTHAALGNWKVRGVPIERCVAIERLGGGCITRKDLRPDDWHDIWPELAQQAPVAINTEASAAAQEVAHG